MNEMSAYFLEEKKKKLENYRELNAYAQPGQILFTGSSLMEQFPICEFAVSAGIGKTIYNRGIGGYTTDEFLESIDVQLLDLEPSKVFINIGTNDIREMPDGEYWLDHLIGNYRAILTKLKERLPETEVYMMAYYPVNKELPPEKLHPGAAFMFKVRSNETIAIANEAVEKLAAEFGYHYIDVNEGLLDEKGNLKAEYTVEGVHMYPNAYRHVFENLRKYL